ncbi:hypothetical protein NW767_000455 [Fusarium falciforme]|nr:hypothetical protein NW767_000455 [Fusarium falciforme]
MQISCLAPVPMMYIEYFAVHCRPVLQSKPPRPVPIAAGPASLVAELCWAWVVGPIAWPLPYRSSSRYLCTYDTPTSIYGNSLSLEIAPYRLRDSDPEWDSA